MAGDVSLIAGDLVRLCRKKRGLTMRELGRLSGVTAAQISNIEHGRNDPKISTFLIMLNAMDFDIEIIDLSNGG